MSPTKITFKNLTVGHPGHPRLLLSEVAEVQVNFGPLPLAELPFKCRMINDAAEADAPRRALPSVERFQVQRIKYRPNDGRPEAPHHSTLSVLRTT